MSLGIEPDHPEREPCNVRSVVLRRPAGPLFRRPHGGFGLGIHPVQFNDYWGYVVALAAGFGLQVALYARLRQVLRNAGPGAVMATTGTTSTAAMVSCCAHYLATAAPVLGTTGLVTFAAQYQVELFWVGLAFNAAGIAYIGRNLFNAVREHAKCVAA